jgi:beta-carotene 3-hydroxylase
MFALSFFLILIGSFLVMEVVAWTSHKYIMHGCLWCLHRSHHESQMGLFERNDWFAVFFAIPSVFLIYIGVNHVPLALASGIGILAYGIVYFLFHDVLVHRRIDLGIRPKRGYLARVVQAHRLHHAVASKDGCVSFGFVFAPSPNRLKEMLRESRDSVLRGPTVRHV